MPFRALHLSPQILQAVRDSGYTEPTPIQIAAIPLILAGHDGIGIAQTGTGKTAAYVLPILMKLAESRETFTRHGDLTANRRDQKDNAHRLRALVLAPTRELVVQIEENVRAYAKHLPLRVATVFGGVSERPQIEALRSGVDMVVATPGRLIDLMEQRAANLFRGRIRGAGRGRSHARHGISSSDSANHEGIAAQTADPHVFRFALA